MAATRNSSRALQRQIDLSTAVCQERLLASHVRHVLAMVDLVSDRLPFDDALDIYVRILHLTPEQARNVGSRALAALGQRSGLPEPEDFGPNADDDVEEDTSSAGATGRADVVFGRLRRRIRGRVHDDLRYRINLSAARAEDDLFATHVENALIFAKSLGDELSVSEAVERYLEIMVIPEGVGDVIYHRALRTVADELLPPLPRAPQPGAARPAAAEPA